MMRPAPLSTLRSSVVHSHSPVALYGYQSGFALITVLWLITALSALVGLSLAATRVGNQASTNRVVLARGRWAAEACLSITQARWREHHLADTSTIDLGRGTRCTWGVSDPSARVNLNSADPELLRGLGLSESFVRMLLERRRQGMIDDLGQVSAITGFDPTWTDRITVTGSGAVNLASASRQVLLALPGLTPEAVQLITYRRSVGRPVTSLDAVVVDLSPPARAALMNRYADLASLTTFAAPQLVVRAVGWVEGFTPRATVEEITVPLPERLAVVARRMW